MKTINIDGVEYIEKKALEQKELTEDFVIIRTYSAGVHAGNLVKREGKEVELANSIRIYQWYGSASLSQLAMEGTKQPEKCKFAMPVDKIILTEAIEIIPCTKEAEQSINGVATWKIK